MKPQKESQKEAKNGSENNGPASNGPAEKPKLHRAWLVLLACFCLYGGTMGAGYNCNGIFNTAISAAMGWRISDYTLSMVFMGSASALMLLFVDRILKKFPLKAVLGISITVFALSVALRSVCRELWQFYLLYAVNGAASSFLFYVPVPMMINSWFKKRQGFALGLAMLSSGIMGTVLNPAISALIEGLGWQTASVINGLIVLLFALPATLLFACRSPKELGLQPYGAEEVPEQPLRVITSPTEAAAAAEIRGTGHSAEEKKLLFAASFVLALLVLVISMIPQQLSHFAGASGLGAAVGASLVSVGMAGNMASKAVMGGCVDRFGKKKTFTASFLLVGIGLLVLAFFPDAPLPVLYAAAFLNGISAANNVVVMPVMVSVYSDGDEYTACMSQVSVATMIGTACATWLCSLIYDLSGSYTLEFLIFAGLNLLAFLLVLRILSAERKR